MSTSIDINSLASKVKFTLRPNGNLGLGIINPTSTLHVKDDIKLGYGGTGAGEVYLTASKYDSNGTTRKIDLKISTEDSNDPGDIILNPGASSNDTGTIYLNSKVKMLNSNFEIIRSDSGNIPTGKGLFYITDITNGALSTAPFHFPEKDYDRIITVSFTPGPNTFGSGTASVRMAIQSSIGNNYYTRVYNLRDQGPYWTGSIIVPAGLKWYCHINTGDEGFVTSYAIYERKFGY